MVASSRVYLWVKDSLGPYYFCNVSRSGTELGYYVAARSVGGDYYAGFCEPDSAGADAVEYFSTLRQAKSFCESAIAALAMSKSKGGRRAGSGRKALDSSGTVVTTVRLTAQQRASLDMLGGVVWLRGYLDSVAGV